MTFSASSTLSTDAQHAFAAQLAGTAADGAGSVSVETSGASRTAGSIAEQAFHAAADGNAIEWNGDGEYVRIDAWGANSVRVRSRLMQRVIDADWALLAPPADAAKPQIVIGELAAAIVNGNIAVKLELIGWQHDQLRLTFLNASTGAILLREASDGGALRLRARAHHPLESGAESPVASFEAYDGEHIYGMGEYQHPVLDLKGSTLELAHRNSQVSVPFMVSSRGYGFLWHNPAVGQVTFGTNHTEWRSGVADQIDYWITAGDTPAQIEAQYADATGHAPVMPEWGLGFWQCKLRYWNQEQLLETAREFKRRNIPIDLIVIDFFHWPLMGDFRFDEEFWPDPKAMADELHKMGIKLMVSVWPQIDLESENYDEMRRRNLLAKTRQGKDVGMWWPRDNQFLDATNPDTRAFVWALAKKNYTDLGVDAFWLDEAEPEWGGDYDYAHYLFHIGPVGKVGNIYPQKYNQTFYDGQLSIGRKDDIVNLTRAAWAGSQRYGSLVWSGDVHSTFDDLKAQITCAIHMGAAGIPWFTTDMGGFAGGDPTSEDFRELYVRWCQFSAFSAVMRNHGDRMPATRVPGKPTFDRKGNPIDHITTGADNEPWTYGPEVERIMVKYINLREAMRPYTRELFAEAHESGQPLVRGLFYEFPGEEAAANVADEYLFGPDILVAPVTELGARSRSVYLPGGSDTSWMNLHTGETFAGGQTITVDAPLDVVPAFARDGHDHGLQGLI
ncbi:TIM-barrel domain-containing protein [Bifidobacterium biavatii]|uniref:Family 31 glucosidase n=1 Tax=Bifidobacterium biavatii DSM 23969 TaxID=1437608 RepID=A0A087A2U0_9BIFI|nr:glycoside hydrolase family 31 protein [Bifidobacterium biavatii]KFI53090.1 family 31 glucosidase [Bifidobacterium biavatii DSM 23969]